MTSLAPLLIDCDPGQDDAVALLLAWGANCFELKAITTVGGNCDAAQGARNARGLRVLAGRSTPVYQGDDCDAAFAGSQRSYVHGPTGIEGFDLPDGGAPTEHLHAVDAIIDYLRATPEAVICALGPLTNIAAALRRDRSAFRNLRRLTMMGGGTERGNRTPAAEFNIWVDPEAAGAVLSAGLPVSMVGLNTTYKALAPESFAQRLAAMPNRTGPAVAGLLEHYGRRYLARLGHARPAVHDAVVVADLVAPGLVTYQRSNVVVELEGRYTRGATVVDLRAVTGREPNADVAVDVDVTRLWSVIEDSLGRLP